LAFPLCHAEETQNPQAATLQRQLQAAEAGDAAAQNSLA
jgi:hypothetical protein